MSPGAPANSLARIFFRRKAMLMRMLRVPTLAGHASGSGVDHAPVALAFTAEAIERRSLLAAVHRTLGWTEAGRSPSRS